VNTDNETPGPPGVVPNDSRELFGFLAAALDDPDGTLPVLADWLDDRGDHRAGAVRDLAGGTIVFPARPRLRTFVPLATGRGWTIARSLSVVRLVLAPESGLARLLGRGWTTRERLYRHQQSPAEVRSAINTCRLDAEYALFGTYAFAVRNRGLITSSPETPELLSVLGRYIPSTGIVASLAAADPARFAELMMLVGRRPRLRRVGEAVVARLRGGDPR
jgi:hypothetical protein